MAGLHVWAHATANNAMLRGQGRSPAVTFLRQGGMRAVEERGL